MDTASTLIAAALAVIFLLSGASKLRSLGTSATALSALRLPVIAPKLTVGALSIAEVGIGIGVLLAPPMLTVAAIAATLLTLTFLIVVWRAHRLGSTDDCGCFGDADASRVGPALIVRNAVLFATAAVLAVLTAAGAQGVPGIVAAVATGDIGAVLPLIAGALVSALVGAVIYARLDGRIASARTPEPPAATTDAPRRIESLVLLDKTTTTGIDVGKRARGRAQLLVFVKPGCTSCEDVLTHLSDNTDAIAPVVDVTTVADIAHGDHVGTRAADDPRITALDLGRLAATAIGVGERRPSAALLSVDGTVVEPLAEGRDEIIELIGAIAAAAG